MREEGYEKVGWEGKYDKISEKGNRGEKGEKMKGERWKY